MYYDHKRYYLLHPKKGLKLIPEPVGWNEDERETGRDVDTLAKKITISNDLEFYGEAADYIREVFEDSNIQNTVKVIEEIKQPDTISEEWEFLRDSDLDLSSYSYENGMVSCKTSTQGLLTQIESQFKEKFVLNRSESVLGKPITMPAEKTMLLEGRELYKYSELQTGEPSGEYGDENFTLRNFPVSVKTSSDQAVKGIFSVLNFNDGTSAANMFYNRVTENQTIKIKISGSFYVDGDYADVRIGKYNYDSGSGSYSFLGHTTIFTSTSEDNLTQNFSYEATLNLTYDQSLSLEFGTQADTEIGDVTYNIKIEEYSVVDPTNTQGMLLNDIGEGLTRIITGKSGLFKSDYLKTGAGKDLFAATGKMLREFPKLDENGEVTPYAYITTSLKEFFEHLLAADNVTWGIERTGNKEILRVEHINYFLKRNIETVLPNKVDLKTVPATDFIYSSVTVGFDTDLDYEEVVGLDETNGKSTWTTPVNKTDNSYELLSPYRMDSNGAELARRTPYETNPTKDTSYDKDIFVFDAYLDVSVYKVRKSNLDFSSVTGLITPDSSYNLRYTPAQLFKKHSNFFLGGFRKVQGNLLFASGEGNTKLETVSLGVNPVTLNESQDFTKAELLNPFFNGEIYEFYHEVTNDILKQINANFYSLFEFTTSEGETKRGFLYSVKEREGIWQILGNR